MAIYHVYSCYELGVETVATRRIPRHCEHCKQQILKPWVSGLEPKVQPRFQPVTNCKYKDILLNMNKWYFVKLEEQRSKKNQNHHKFMDEDANLYRKDLRDHVGNLMYSEIAEGNVGAFVVNDEEARSIFRRSTL